MRKPPFSLSSPEFEQLSYDLKDDPRPMLFSSVRQANDDDQDFGHTEKLIDAGLIAWRVWNAKPGLKYLYTHQPINPHSGRPLSAMLQMTTLALEYYAQDLYDLFVANSTRSLPPFAEWRNEALRTFIPVKPELQSVMTLHYVAPSKNASVMKIGKGGHVEILSKRRVDKLLYFRDGDSLLDLLDQWKVGPNTISENTHVASLNDEIIRVSLQNFGLKEIDTLIARGFKVHSTAYEFAMHGSYSFNRTEKLIEVWNGLDQRGIAAPCDLWFTLAKESHWHKKEVVQWLKDHQVSWHTLNEEGANPLATWTNATIRHLHLEDTFSPLGLVFATLAPMSQMFKSLKSDLKDQENDSAIAIKVAVEMIKDGVDPFKKDQHNRSALDEIYPDQGKATEFLQQKIRTQEPGLSDQEVYMKAMRVLLGNHHQLSLQRGVYGSKTLAFIDHISQLTGYDFFANAQTLDLTEPPPLQVKFRR